MTLFDEPNSKTPVTRSYAILRNAYAAYANACNVMRQVRRVISDHLLRCKFEDVV